MKQRFLYLWYPHLATDRYIQASSTPEEYDQRTRLPFATTLSDHRGVKLCGLNTPALKETLRPQMRLGDARAIYPNLQTEPMQPALDHEFLLHMAKVADQFSPWVALDGPHCEQGEAGLWLEMTGAAHLFGGEENLLEQVSKTYEPLNCTLRLGLADTALAAWAAARFHKGNGRLQEGRIAEETQNFPLEALDLDGELIQRLNRLGLRNLADVRDVPRANLRVRFGQEIMEKLDQLSGFLPLQLSYLHATAFYEEQQFFADPLGAADIIENAVAHLLEQICTRLKEDNLGIRCLGLRFQRVDNKVTAFQIATSAPTYDVKHLMRLLDDYLPGVDPGFGVEHVHLRATQTQWFEKGQDDLTQDRIKQTNTAEQNALIDRLRHRLGADAVSFAQPQASYVPERALQYAMVKTDIAANEPHLPTRPIRLLSPPEPLDILAQNTAGLPTQCRWRRLNLSFTQITGPERITREWWRKLSHDLWDAQLGMRDYYRAEAQDGRSLWLCCVQSANQNRRWFVHGWFG